jgi:hypothetical protein
MLNTQQSSLPLSAQAIAIRLMVRCAVVLGGWLLACAGGLLAVEMLPESIARTLLSQAIVLTWAVGVFAIGAWSASLSHAHIYNGPLRTDYVNQVAPIVERWLFGIGGMAAMVMCGLAAATWIWEMSPDAGAAPIVAVWMLFAAVLPVDSGASTTNRRDAQIVGAFAPWAFVLAFPCYMHGRIGRSSRKASAIAGAMILAFIGGFALFVLRTQP